MSRLKGRPVPALDSLVEMVLRLVPGNRDERGYPQAVMHKLKEKRCNITSKTIARRFRGKDLTDPLTPSVALCKALKAIGRDPPNNIELGHWLDELVLLWYEDQDQKGAAVEDVLRHARGLRAGIEAKRAKAAESNSATPPPTHQ